MTDLPVIDRARLDLVCMGKPEMAREFLDILIEESTPILAVLPASIAAADHTAVRSNAHAVKGIAGNVGAARLHDAAQRLELSAKDGAAAAVLAEQLAAVVAALAEVRAERDAVS